VFIGKDSDIYVIRVLEKIFETVEDNLVSGTGGSRIVKEEARKLTMGSEVLQCWN
jgi:hypothetical protein